MSATLNTLSLNQKTLPSIYTLVLAVPLIIGSLLGQVTITSLEGDGENARVLGAGWDYNNNGLPEVLLLRTQSDKSASDMLVYLEIGTGASPDVLWSYQPPSEGVLLTDAGIGDLGGNGTPELIVLLHHQALFDNAAPDWLVFFSWGKGQSGFSEEPYYRWNYRGKGVSYLRPTELLVADLDNNGDDELVITVGSPDRMVLVADWRGQRLRAVQEFRPGSIISGSRSFSVVAADFNGDIRKDLLIISHDDSPTLMAYINRRTDFRELSIANPPANPVLPAAITAGDLNGDGQEQVVLPHPDGSLTLVGMVGPRLSAERLDTVIDGLVDLAIFDFDRDDSDELLYLLSDGSVTTNDSRFPAPLTVAALAAQLPAGVPPPTGFPAFALMTGSGDQSDRLILPATGPAGLMLIVADLAPGDIRPAVAIEEPAGEPEQTPDVPGGVPALPLAVVPPVALPVVVLEPEVVTEEGGDVYFPDRNLPPDPRALPPHRTPDVLLYAGDEFERNVLGERAEQFAHFRFLRKPPGMIFNFQRQAIVWQPSGENLGAWNVEFEITFQTGVNYEDVVTDSAQDFAVVPEMEVVRDQMLIYVNDKPRITSRPETERLLAGNLFAYRIQVDDRNSDARNDFRLESGPEGMVLDRNGILTWRTDETHHDNYQVV
ncbi:MAG: VCBS repeat-containing protein, partial [Candidatus Neomarinimicrobiota bacterium]